MSATNRDNESGAWDGRRILAFGVFLLLPLLGLFSTRIMRDRALEDVGAHFDQRSEQLAWEAVASAARRFEGMVDGMMRVARDVSNEPVVVSGLLEAGLTEGQDGAVPGTAPIVRRFGALTLPPRTAVELFTANGRLVSWSGFAIDPERVRAEPPPVHLRSAVVKNSGREAIELYVPVAQDGVPIGVVRVVRLTQVSVHVPSDYLRAYSLEDELGRDLPAEIDLVLGDTTVAGDARPEPGPPGSTLRGPDGRILGSVKATLPRPGAVEARVERRYGDVEAFWSTLLLGWLFAGIWLFYRERSRRRQHAGRGGGPRSLTGLFALVAGSFWGLRYALLALDVPARWFPTSPLFDPRFLASGVASGAARSVGDLMLSALALLLFALALAELATAGTFPRFADRNARRRQIVVSILRRLEHASWPLFIVGCLMLIAALVGVWLSLGTLVRRVILDSTLDYFAWTGLAPEPLVLIVLTALLLATLSAILIASGLTRIAVWWLSRVCPIDVRTAPGQVTLVAIFGLPILLIYALTPLEEWMPWWTAAGLWSVGLLIAGWDLLRGADRERLLFLKNLLAILLVTTILLYPLVYRSMMLQREIRIEEVADDYVARKDAEVRILVEQVLDLAGEWRTPSGGEATLPPLDRLFAGGELAFGGEYGVAALLLDESERPVATTRTEGAPLLQGEHDWGPIFAALRENWSPDAEDGRIMGRTTDSRNVERSVYGGLQPVDWRNERYWLLVAAAPRTVRFARQDPEDLSEGLRSYPDWRRSLSIAEFREGHLVRSEGGDIGRRRLPQAVEEALARQPAVWIQSDLYGQMFLTYYRRQAGVGDEASVSVIAVRTRATIPYDHLYYMLRIAVSALMLGLAFFGVGLAVRLFAGRFPAGEARFGDRVMNAFMIVGAVAVILMGWLGQNVIQRENRGAVQSRLERRLERVESALLRKAAEGETAFEVLARVPINALAEELSLDLNVYQGERLSSSSSTAQQEQLLAYSRLPVQAYEELYLEGLRQSFVTLDADGESLFTIGYLALTDAQGYARAVIAVLTIPEQERIREERARTTAYLFGALLLLLLVVMATATFLARRLTMPIRNLRDGLRAVAAGRFQRPIPVESNDEVGALVESFNTMQEQLADSRLRLAQQERELAWREMAKQVAHEIKNPLTPMKLSIQHLQRAFEGVRDGGDLARFSQLFERITRTLTDQIDALAHIANEFYTFARLPKRNLEAVELQSVIGEAVELLRNETTVTIDVFIPQQPLMVRGDREELRRVYINLLKNADQAIPPEEQGAVTVRAWLEPGDRPGRDQIVSTVTDTGAGIPQDVQDRIFQPNFSTKTSGMGLGLAIVKKAVEDMRGTIAFVTWEAGGTTFTVRLPAAEER